MAMRSKLRAAGLLLLAWVALELPGWSQCVMCGTALSSSPEGRALAGSFRYGIGMLLIAPYLIIGTIAYAIYRAFKRRVKA